MKRKSTKLAKADLSFLLCAAAHYSETGDLHPAKICLLQDCSAGLEGGKENPPESKRRVATVSPLLAPTGALYVMVPYYTAASASALYQLYISHISVI